jgi:aminodeoxyfutalosine synthase
MSNNRLLHPGLLSVERKIVDGHRLSSHDAELLFSDAPLAWLGMLADQVRQYKHGRTTWYNRNFHIEPTNRCVYHCKFCSYSEHHCADVWDYGNETIRSLAASAPEGITEIHIVGGVAPGRGVAWYSDLIRAVHEVRPGLHIKAYSAIEISYMSKVDGIPLNDTLKMLMDAGLDAVPGGGAEIFDPEIRKKICPEKDDATQWLEVHRTAHQLGIPTNATILYGHIERYRHRVDHMLQLRELQDETGGFKAFIPLKFRSANNPMSAIGEVSATEDLRNYAVSRLFLDNIPHLKAYWPMIGRDVAAIAQSFGVDDLDGTIHDSTKIYSTAGADDTNPAMDVAQISALIKDAGYEPRERDSMYRPVGSV